MEPTVSTTPAVTPNNTSTAPTGSKEVGAPTSEKVGNPTDKPTQEAAPKQEKQERPESGKESGQKKTRILKVDGKEYEVEEEYLERLAQKGFGAEKKLWEANEARKKSETERAQLAEEKKAWEDMKKMSPRDRIKAMEAELKDPNLSKDFRAALEEHLYEYIKADEQTPEQRELAQLRKEKEEREKQVKAEEEAKVTKAKEEALNTWKKKSEASIIEALEHSKMPKTPWNVKHIADIMYNHRKLQQSLPENERFDLSPEEISKRLTQDHTENVHALSGEVSKQIIEAHKAKDHAKVLELGDRLVEMFGEECMDALRRYDLAKHTTMKPKLPEPVTETPKETLKKDNNKYQSWEEYKEQRRKTAEALQTEWKRA